MLSAHPDAARNAWITVTAPDDGRTLGTLPMHTPDRVRAVIGGLRDAQTAWRTMGAVGRVRWLTRFRDWLLANEEAITASLAAETGKSVAEALREFRFGIDALDYHRTRGADFLGPHRLRRNRMPSASMHLAIAYRPCAVVGVLTSWIYPLASTLFDAVPALLAGSAVVVKPSSVTPLTVRAVLAGWTQIGAPPVLQFVAGHKAGPTVVDGADYVHFSGSPEIGRVVALRAAARLVPCRLEIGGKSAAVVLADADPEAAAAAIALGGLAESGQTCRSIERVFVESAGYDAFVERLVAAVTAYGATDPGELRGAVLTSSAHVRYVHDQVRDARAKGAIVRLGGTGGGHVFEPTVLVDAEPTMRVLTQQTLGPILPVVRVENRERVIALANEAFGPCASVWTTDEAAGAALAERLNAAQVGVNDMSLHLMEVE
ncbi:aldehyde dehydrogenase family protein [Nocardia terpenica]|uniref:Aldehyde dehydrogenase domain-containing protein n=1 Tax=Nocardia terpenica TaxID=455432 RepID=A0A164J4Y6_9NOCA|nr:aldehyde dehydrogenase family protein [Nocardia terpenica]KZM70050.1 hypothetical protein AWN90_05550 [Nocardia terpenica]MBF6064011.1 aldehyde dehydrogenase family protein [Nocardia terpenica]MBF6107753.1 aldehyde dehydrogenase family protein [Nocardia terpenica]MBF6114821.1 aldehyde dehydrogenase family protein [Nocardia terpenica]MBF6121192.1 aldehyde dehydrogenase family protein [Nocardia terpenica]